MPKKTPDLQKKERHPFRTALIILVSLFILASIFAFVFTDSSTGSAFGNVALIPIKGTIAADSSGGLFTAESASATDIVDLLGKAKDDPEVNGVILEIDSPGGSAVASAEIAQAVKDVRAANKTVVAWIRESGASGAYWIAADCDYIVAHPLSITGSVGVISSYLDFSGLMQRYNVTYARLVAGSYKDMGTPYKELTPQEQALFQAKLDKVQDVFLGEVAKQRNLTNKQQSEIKSGIFYLGSEAKDLHLVDELGGKKEAVAYLERKLNATVTIKQYEVKRSLWAALNNVMDEKAFYAGQGAASALLSKQESFMIQAR